MSENDYNKRLEELDKALQEATKKEKKTKRKSDLSLTSKILAELISGIFVGLFLGTYIDKYFATEPLFTIILTLLGFAGGFWNIYKELEKK